MIDAWMNGALLGNLGLLESLRGVWISIFVKIYRWFVQLLEVIASLFDYIFLRVVCNLVWWMNLCSVNSLVDWCTNFQSTFLNSTMNYYVRYYVMYLYYLSWIIILSTRFQFDFKVNLLFIPTKLLFVINYQ